MDLARTVDVLKKANVEFAPGLSGAEIAQAEQAYGLKFPADLKEFLMFGLPVSKNWPNWRELKSPSIESMLKNPVDGICFDVEHNDFWLQEWGQRPALLKDALTVARKKVAEAPMLIPVSGHRYIPEDPSESGNPVFSVSQTDIIYYGSDLLNYFENEFNYYFQTPQYSLREPIKKIKFWSQMVQ